MAGYCNKFPACEGIPKSSHVGKIGEREVIGRRGGASFQHTDLLNTSGRS